MLPTSCSSFGLWKVAAGVAHAVGSTNSASASNNLCIKAPQARVLPSDEISRKSPIGGRYTRYADDLAFSGDAAFAQRVDTLLAALREIASEEGFALNAAKTRVMRRARPQRITGIVVNEHANVARASYDQLKAILHNCRTRGPSGENREGHSDFRAHLDGRVGWVEQVNPARGARLRAICNAIAWP